jgi:hypothetical protein
MHCIKPISEPLPGHSDATFPKCTVVIGTIKTTPYIKREARDHVLRKGMWRNEKY